MSEDRGLDPVVELIVELPPPHFRVTVDTSFPIVDQAFGNGSGSGWRLFEPVAGEEPPWLSIGDSIGNTYRQRAMVPRSQGPALWAAVCQVSLTWLDEVDGTDPTERSTTVDGSVRFAIPAGGQHTVVCVLHRQDTTDTEPANWQLTLR